MNIKSPLWNQKGLKRKTRLKFIFSSIDAILRHPGILDEELKHISFVGVRFVTHLQGPNGIVFEIAVFFQSGVGYIEELVQRGWIVIEIRV